MPSFESEVPSTRPYLIRALHEWCLDNGFSPYISVQVDASVAVPMEFVKSGEIVLNVGLEATHALRLGNDFIEFQARFGGVAREISVPVSHVTAIYARENGQGMAFPAPVSAMVVDNPPAAQRSDVHAAARPTVEGHDAEKTSPRGALHAVMGDEAIEEGSGGMPAPPKGPTPLGGRPRLTRVK
jgi:stringent starvation protein B